MESKRMYFIIEVLFVMCVMLHDRVSGDERQLYRNMQTPSCPNGVVFREGCKLCFCISLFDGNDVVKCKSRFASQACRVVSKSAHCEPANLLYDYDRECEGGCSCNQGRNLTTCENLPCDDTLLWFHGYYNESDKGHPVRKSENENEIESTTSVEDSNMSDTEEQTYSEQTPDIKEHPVVETHTVVEKHPVGEEHTGKKHKARRPKVVEVKTIYFNSEQDDGKSTKPSKNFGANKSGRRFVSKIAYNENLNSEEHEKNEESANKRKHHGRRQKRDVNNRVEGDFEEYGLMD